VDYLGLGCAAYGTISEAGSGALRYRNVPVPERYMAAATGGGRLTESEERIDPETRLRERIMLGLRLREGIDIEGAAAALGVPAWTPARLEVAERLTRQGRLRAEGRRISIPRGAWLFADGIAASLF
jgi:oxygen-independent coproporphyrinogen-3 oxidase